MLLLLSISCRRETKTVTKIPVKKDTTEINIDTNEIVETIVTKAAPAKKTEIYGDTVWVYPYGTKSWQDSLISDKYSVRLKVWVDTTDYIIDTVRSKKGARLVIGYNHYYSLVFTKKGKPWFTVKFNKREDLAALIEGTEVWIESNLNVFKDLVYNEKYDKFVVEFDINPQYNFGAIFYLVVNTSGEIDYIGTSSSWGGGGPDGSSFLTDNRELYVTCFEIYSFAANLSVTVGDYAVQALKKYGESQLYSYDQLHALRYLGNNFFLTIFNRHRNMPEKNALILNSDTTLMARFRYYGLMEEMDALLMYTSLSVTRQKFLYDTDREMLICINPADSVTVKEFPVNEMLNYNSDTLKLSDSLMLDFEAFSSYRFYFDTTNNRFLRRADESY